MLKEIERLILVGVLRDRDAWAAEPWNPHTTHGKQLGAYRIQIEEARDGYARVNLTSWIGRALSPTDRKAASRAYKRLEELGLLERHNLWGWSTKTSHLSLTPAGKQAAKALLSPSNKVEA